MEPIAEALRDLNEKKVLELVEQALSGDIPAIRIVEQCNQGMTAVGELFGTGRYFISQLIFSAEILKGVMRRLGPLLENTEKGNSAGKIVLGTVKGDIHDIGKNIVATLLRGSGFEVIDLGVDTPAERFIQAIRETEARVLGLSALLNFTYPEMKNVVDAAAAAGIRDRVRIIIGGAPVNEQVRAFTGADFYAEDAVVGVRICKSVYGALFLS